LPDRVVAYAAARQERHGAEKRSPGSAMSSGFSNGLGDALETAGVVKGFEGRI
jgi:hypothetical protein